MEHGIILLIEAIIALDRKLQKPLSHVIPEHAKLRTAPREFLQDEPVVIGPRRAYAVASVLGLVVAIGALVVFIIAALERPRRQPLEPAYVIGAILAVVVSGIATTALLLRWLRGGSAILRAEGVEFIYRGRSLFCPWNLFQAPGAPYQPDHKRVILPANDAVVLGERLSEDEYRARPAHEVKTTALSACADGQVALTDLYEVKLAEIGQLLLDLGARLGDGVVAMEEQKAAALVPLATAEADGWMRIRLTRLPFPPVCCHCGNLTRETITLPLDARNTGRLELPLCMACQVERTSRRRRALLWGLGLGLAPTLLWVLAAGPLLRVGEICMGIGVFLPLGLVLGLIVGFVLRDRADPVRFRDYSTAAGTVAMRLKFAPGSRVFRKAVGIEEQPAAAEAASTP
jgi:hypothetical protein